MSGLLGLMTHYLLLDSIRVTTLPLESLFFKIPAIGMDLVATGGSGLSILILDWWLIKITHLSLVVVATRRLLLHGHLHSPLFKLVLVNRLIVCLELGWYQVFVNVLLWLTLVSGLLLVIALGRLLITSPRLIGYLSMPPRITSHSELLLFMSELILLGIVVFVAR